MDQNRRFAELAGICWHELVRQQIKPGVKECSCGKIIYNNGFSGHIKDSNPDFCADPREVLKVVMERDDWIEFLDWLRDYDVTDSHYISVDYITTPSKLRDAWIEWKEKQK